MHFSFRADTGTTFPPAKQHDHVEGEVHFVAPNVAASLANEKQWFDTPVTAQCASGPIFDLEHHQFGEVIAY